MRRLSHLDESVWGFAIQNFLPCYCRQNHILESNKIRSKTLAVNIDKWNIAFFAILKVDGKFRLAVQNF